MSDTIGRITVPSITASGTFPLVTKWPHGQAQKRLKVVHVMGSASAKILQRFYVGSPAVRYTLSLPQLTRTQRGSLRDFWEATQGCVGAFTYHAPQEDGATVDKTVCFENQPLTFDELTDTITQVQGLTLVAIVDPASTPAYPLNGTDTRFPGGTLSAALLSQVQQMIPLVRIRVTDSAVPDIFLSDQRCSVGGQLYLPRLLEIGDPGSEALVSQNTDGSSDDVSLSFGNADRVMVQLANDTQLRWAAIELSFYHVGTGIKIDIWAGKVIDWNSDAGPVFSIRASDVLSALTLSSPVGTAGRDCRRRYGLDGCPAVPGSQAMDTTHFPSSSNLSCDFGYNTPNGCMAHQVEQSFGATYATPESILIFDKSNSGGGALITPTSIIDDTVWGQSIPEIWHNDEGVPQYGLPVPCKIVDGRDESDFYVAMGIIGAGPLGALATAQMYDSNGDGIPDTFLGATLDGQPNHGFQVDSLGHLKVGSNPLFGLRYTLGTDPAGSHDYFSLGRVSGPTGGYPIGPRGWFTNPADSSPMEEIYDTGSSYNLIYSAGVALLEVRRTDAAGIQPSLPGTHELLALISQGLSGLTWSGPGSRSSVAGCTDPFWVAINTFLRALGLLGASASTQEQYFDVAAAIAASSIASTTVSKVFGTGTETQFQFKGMIDKRQPTRDWLRSILNCAAGYFTWSFGRLRLGCRYNASAQSAYTAGNTIFGSLALRPIQSGFEKLTVKFNDQEYLFAANTVNYIDRDCAARNGRVQNPLESEFSLPGTSTKSQAARVAVARAREELGGALQPEQDRARLASWKTTILGLDTEAGMVVSQTDPDIPGPTGTCSVSGSSVTWASGDQFSSYLINKQVLINGVQVAFTAVADATHATVSPAPGNGSGLSFRVITADFRVQSWRLNRDFSIDIMGKSVVPDMYDLTVGPKPADVAASPIPTDTGRDSAPPPAPIFSVRRNPLDAEEVEIYGLGFADSRNTKTVKTGTLGIYTIANAAASQYLAVDITDTDATLTLDSVTGIFAGTLIVLDREILLCGAPSGLNVPITRGQFGSTASTHDHGAGVWIVSLANFVFAWPPATSLSTWRWDTSLAPAVVVAVTLFATNAYGDGDLAEVCLTPLEMHGLTLTQVYPRPWAPGFVAPLAGDAMYPEGTSGLGQFGLQPEYNLDAQGNGSASLLIRGKLPINYLNTPAAPPQIACVASSSGGALKPGIYVVGLAAFDTNSDHGTTDYLELAVLEVAGTGSGSIAVTVTWGSGDHGGDLYMSAWTPDGYVFHRNQTLTPGQASATIVAFDQSTEGGPDSLFHHFSVVWQKEIHGGPWAQQVQAVAPTTITIAGDGMNVDDWAGRVLTLLAKYDTSLEIPVLNMPVTSSTVSSGGLFDLTIGPNSEGVQLPDLTTLLEVGDLVMMRNLATFTDDGFSDPMIANPYYPTGADASVEPTHVAVMLTGDDTGDVQTISSVVESSPGSGKFDAFKLSGKWKITPATGDLVVICSPSQLEVPSRGWVNRNSELTGIVAQPGIANDADQTWLLKMRTADKNGLTGQDYLAPFRDFYLFGTQGTLTVKD